MKKNILLFVTLSGLLCSCNVNNVIYNEPEFYKYSNVVDYDTFINKVESLADSITFLEDESSFVSSSKANSISKKTNRRNNEDFYVEETVLSMKTESKYDVSNEVVKKEIKTYINNNVNSSSEDGKSHTNYYISNEEEDEAQKLILNEKEYTVLLNKENKTYKKTADSLKDYALSESIGALNSLIKIDKDEIDKYSFYVDNNVLTQVYNSTTTTNLINFDNEIIGTSSSTESIVLQYIFETESFKFKAETKNENIKKYSKDDSSYKSGDKVTSNDKYSIEFEVKKDNVSLSKTNLSNYEEGY